MTSRQFKVHLASILDRKRREEAETERGKTKQTSKSTAKVSAPKPVKISRQPETPTEKKPPAAVSESSIVQHWKIRRSR